MARPQRRQLHDQIVWQRMVFEAGRQLAIARQLLGDARWQRALLGDARRQALVLVLLLALALAILLPLEALLVRDKMALVVAGNEPFLELADENVPDAGRGRQHFVRAQTDRQHQR